MSFTYTRKKCGSGFQHLPAFRARNERATFSDAYLNLNVLM